MEPERKIEKLLRGFAKKRRADAGHPLELHPANRRTLQDEVARQAKATGEGNESNLFLLLFAVFRRRLVFVLCVMAVAVLGTSMLLPAISKYRSRTREIMAINNLKQIVQAVDVFFSESNRLPASLDEIKGQLASDKVLIDPQSGKPFVYVGSLSNSVVAYSPANKDGSVSVAFWDGHVDQRNAGDIAELTNQKPVELALADNSARAQSAETPLATAPVASTQPAPTLSGGDKVEIAQAKEQSKVGDLGVNAPSASVPSSLQPELAQTEAVKLGPAATPAPALQPAAELEKTKLNGAVTQNFAQAGVAFNLQNRYRNDSASAQTAPVLQSFQVQQDGEVISVVDGDGSVYHGSLQPTNATALNEPVPAGAFATRVVPGSPPQSQTKAAQAFANEQQAVQNYFFRVTGMNRTLKQNVVFTGNVLANNNTLQSSQTSNFTGEFGGGGGGNSAGNQFRQAVANQSQQSLLSNSRIVGTAVIASTNQIEINAVPVTQ